MPRTREFFRTGYVNKVGAEKFKEFIQANKKDFIIFQLEVGLKDAGNDEALMEKYFDKGELTEDEIKDGMKKAMIQHELFPLFCLSAERNMGSGRLMGFIDAICPSSNEMPPQKNNTGIRT